MLCGDSYLKADRASVIAAQKGMWLERLTSRFSLYWVAEGTESPISHFPDVLSSHLL